MMNKELQNLLCNCSSGCVGNPSNQNAQQRNNYDCRNFEYPIYESDRDEKLLDDWKVLDDDSWDVISALRQKFCQLSRSEAESATVRESPRSSCTYTNRHPIESRSLIEKANDLIDYTPESEFLRKIKQQCQYLQNRLPNIFSALNDCFPEGEVNECQKCLLLRLKAQHSNGRLWRSCNQQPNFNNEVPYRDKKMRMKHSSIFQRPCSEKEKVYPLECLKVDKRKSDHISRPKKRDRSRRFRKRKSNDSQKCLSENDFEPSLKKPNENSCERCWRFASPARSPVNKPDQRYDPNFRRGHSATSVPKGDGDIDYCGELNNPDFDEQRNTLRNMDKESPCARPTCNTRNRSPVNGSQPYTSPHICIKQKMEAAWQMGQNSCPKHGYDASPLGSQFPNEYANLPLPSQRGCSQHRSSPQQVPSPPRMQHVCPKHTCCMHEGSNLRPKPRCSIHEPEPPEQRCSQQRSPRKVSPPHISPSKVPPQHVCSSTRSPQQTVPQQTYPQEGISQQRCSQQTSPHPGAAYDSKYSQKQPRQESSRGLISSCPKGRSQRPQSCGQGCKGRSPLGVEDLDVTEYKDICVNQKKQNVSPCPEPCSMKKPPPCGDFLPKPPKPCDRSRMETIPEDSRKNTDGDKSGGIGGDKSGSQTGGDRSGSQIGGNKSSSQTGGDKLDSQSAKQSKTSSKDSKNKSQKSPADSKGTKKDKSDKKEKKSPDKAKKSPDKGKKSPDKGKSSLRGRGKDEKVGGAGTCGAKKPSQFDKAHPLRPCKCFPRIPETDQPPGSYRTQGQTLCCHCDWEEEKNNQVIPPSQRDGFRNGNQNCYCNTPRQNVPSPERVSPIPKAGAMECPYRAFTNKFGSGGGQPSCRLQQEDSHRCSRESHSEISTQELLQCTPRKYFMFYMTQEKEKNKDVEVLVEELAQGCSKSEAASRTKDIREKMKKINEPPPDSMALRFQKGVSELCNVPQSSRLLYF